MASPKTHNSLEEVIAVAQRRAQQINKPIYIVPVGEGFAATRVKPGMDAVQVIYPLNYRPKSAKIQSEFTHEADLKIAKNTIEQLTDDTQFADRPDTLEVGKNYLIVIAVAPFSFETRFTSTLLAKLTTDEDISWYVFDNGVIIEKDVQFNAYSLKE